MLRFFGNIAAFFAHFRFLLLILGFAGIALTSWAAKLNPKGARIGPSPVPFKFVRTGPYRWFTHPMYVGQWLAVTCFMWYGAGFWAAFSISIVSELVFREWIWRENGSPDAKSDPTQA
ncbi:hypothetical protein [Mesoterricola sediminis]|uniref:hypothetical protein n=1 Tax=Mesoterricola sediminis TaxID=2927980 RepID=UPI00292EC90E|nr:hypothetical protein [Mesoterricola sediminis]